MDTRALEEILDYRFQNKQLLLQALTHGSYNHDISQNYERLEFLGDRVLGVAMARLLYNIFPTDPEGDLSPRFTRLVRTETVAQVALDLNLNKYIRAENRQLCRNKNVLCDVTEAIIGAICIEAGFETAIDFVERNFKPLINQNSEPLKDKKTLLQEVSHQLKAGNPVYELVKKEGSEHEPVFFIQVTVTGHGTAVGSGKNKKIAEQNAAAQLLDILENK